MPNLNGEVQVQRIIKKKGGHGGHHGGAWKVAYADFVTAMMALFIVLWIMSQSQSIRQNVAQYFKEPGLLPATSGLLEHSSMSGDIPTPGQSQGLQRSAAADVMDDARRLEETKKKIQEMIAKMPELQKLQDQISLQITNEGLRIELMEKENARFFEVGSALVNPQAQKIFGIISKELGNLPNHLTVEGHTDSRPYGRQDYTNWELSSDRANAARRLMDTYGTKPGQISEVRGYADRRLLNDQNPNDYKNRRVSIIVRPMDQEKAKPLYINPAPAGAGEKIEPPAPAAKPVTPPAAPALPAQKPPAAMVLPALQPPPPPGQAKAGSRAPGPEKVQTEAAPAPPPSPPKETKTEKAPLEENLGLQKELLNLTPKLSPITIK